jgi:L-fuculose-phosphate aldolase
MTGSEKVSVLEAKKIIVDVGLKCWQKGWVAANDGNISWRIAEDEVLCTPTGVSKGMLTLDHICTVDMDGTVRQKNGDFKPSSEIKMHLRVLKERQDVNSVFHAHPPYATAHAIAGIPLAECVIPEIVIGFGSIPIVPYGTPSTNEIPDRLAPFIKDYDAWLLENHGALTCGVDAYQSFFRMESVELFAQMMFIAKSLGKVNSLDNKQVQALIQLRQQFGIANKNNICTNCGACGKPNSEVSGYDSTSPKLSASSASDSILDPALVDTIVKRIKEALGG